MGLGNEKTVSLNGNHIEITKYASKNHDNFVRVSGNIRKIVTKIVEEATSRLIQPYILASREY